MRVVTDKDNEGNKGGGNKYYKDDNLLSIITDVCVKFVVVVFGLQLDG